VTPPSSGIGAFQLGIVLIELECQRLDLGIRDTICDQVEGFFAERRPNISDALKPGIVMPQLLDHQRSRGFGKVCSDDRETVPVRAYSFEDREAVDIKRH
jgi:hypothetical protein